MNNLKDAKRFAHEICDWYRLHHRKLPFRETHDPYKIMVSELMLQQTQMETVLPYYQRFIERFPDVATLASAKDTEVLKYWEGLGYYRRARYLHQAAIQIVEEHHGAFPKEYQAIKNLKGVGEYTAGAIHSIAFNQPSPAIDGNVHRVLSRVIEYQADVSTRESHHHFEKILKNLIKHEVPRYFTQAMMELGALVCKKNPLCHECPVSHHCKAYQSGKQMDYPVKKSKKPIVNEEYFTFLLINEDNKAVLIRRPEKGLLANLLAFPQYHMNDLDDALKQFENDFNVVVDSVNYRFDVTHIFSHKKWCMHVYQLEVKTFPNRLKFYDLKALPEAISKAHAKIIENI